ncbi:MAG: HU family DNA-binding protein [Candidatus Margulisbacteria bacterium]|nr:HU family DNA-binding protein [Candidatus Margulisiibacteriota bacterium]MBU1021893.1 HU family DNA-binding protein [Candidatus Margulisiibacteriota bacterium]MBU1728531.1 HU family DNA-binding protein [Candidatus Margulisiibacteriota bacterium]MBU1954678.1 HU family DNA-binding protein [Candidatus Margulisiibacteriota bacterium]
MNKQELIESMSKKTKMPKTRVLNFIDSFVDTVSTELKKGKKVQLVGFGSWQKRKRKARMGRNPQTGKEIKIGARNIAKFSMGQKLFERIN